MDNTIDKLQLLKTENIEILESTEENPNTTALEIDGEIIHTAHYSATACKIIPHYRDNPGFFHVFSGTGECILLKACYHDSIRLLKKGIELSDDALIELSKAALSVEAVLKGPHEIWAAITPNNEVFIAKVKESTTELHPEIDTHIPRPLTTGEYDNYEGAYQESLLSRAMLNNVLPERLSYFASNILQKYPDIMHAYFLAFEAKVQSPSVQIVNGRPYMNISGIMSAMRESKTDRKEFAASFMPWQKVFDKDKPVKPELSSIEYIPMEEVDEFIAGLKEQIDRAGAYSLFEENYLEPIGHLTMLQMMMYFIFQEQWLYLVRLTGLDKTEVLQWIYSTRENSPFIKGAEMDIPMYFDPACENTHIKIAPVAELGDKETVIGKLSAITRIKNKKKILSMLSATHKVLDTRDTVTSMAGTFHQKSREAIMTNSQYLKDKGRFDELNDVFMLDMQDFRKLVHDTYYAGLLQIMQYRKSYQHRSAAQAMPYEMYAGDIRYAWRISEEQLYKNESVKEFACCSYNHNEQEGIVHKAEGNMDAKICCARAFPLAQLATIGKPAAIITDIAAIFSYVTEFSLLTRTPLYYGVRHSELILPGKAIKTESKKIILK